jgi:hypothetical protein
MTIRHRVGVALHNSASSKPFEQSGRNKLLEYDDGRWRLIPPELPGASVWPRSAWTALGRGHFESGSTAIFRSGIYPKVLTDGIRATESRY